jgi:hypothetical protein
MTNPGQQDGTGPFIDLDSITVYSASIPGNSAGDAAPSPSAIANQRLVGWSRARPRAENS